MTLRDSIRTSLHCDGTIDQTMRIRFEPHATPAKCYKGGTKAK